MEVNTRFPKHQAAVAEVGQALRSRDLVDDVGTHLERSVAQEVVWCRESHKDIRLLQVLIDLCVRIPIRVSRDPLKTDDDGINTVRCQFVSNRLSDLSLKAD